MPVRCLQDSFSYNSTRPDRVRRTHNAAQYYNPNMHLRRAASLRAVLLANGRAAQQLTRVNDARICDVRLHGVRRRVGISSRGPAAPRVALLHVHGDDLGRLCVKPAVYKYVTTEEDDPAVQ